MKIYLLLLFALCFYTSIHLSLPIDKKIHFGDGTINFYCRKPTHQIAQQKTLKVLQKLHETAKKEEEKVAPGRQKMLNACTSSPNLQNRTYLSPQCALLHDVY